MTRKDRTSAGFGVQLDRRQLLKLSGGLALEGLLLGVHVDAMATTRPAADSFAPNAFVCIDRSGRVTITIPSCEMGQGIYTGLATVVAEELDVSFKQVGVMHSPVQAAYRNPLMGDQLTGGSMSVRAWWGPLRMAGASARELLVRSAAMRWSVPASECRTEEGVVLHARTNRRLPYGDLIDVASKLPLPDAREVHLKSSDSFKLIGRELKRLDAPDKINGKAVFGIDARPPGVKIAAIAASPVFGGEVAKMDERAALAINGVRQVIALPGAIAVVADHTGAAMKGLAALKIEWADDGPLCGMDSAQIERELATASETSPGAVARSEGDVSARMAEAAHRLEAVYQMPFLAHAPMEPLNCTVHVRPDGCDIWLGTQAPARVQAVAAQLTRLPLERVVVHNTYLGGGFGRKSETDYVEQAVKIASEVNAPVKLLWSREEDIQQDMFRPYYYDRLSAGLDASGLPVAWRHRITGSSLMGRIRPAILEKTGVDPDAVDGAVRPIYDLPCLHVDYVRHESPGVRTSFWRGVGAGHNSFVIESFIDELAHLAQQDPVAYRKRLLHHAPRALAVLDLVAEKSGWSQSKLPPGHGRGVAVQFAFGSYLAQVAEVEVTPDADLRVHRIVTAVDCGQVINPNTVEAQVQGGSIYGLSAALYGAITFQRGRVEQGNFHNYRVTRMSEAPRAEVHFVRSTESPGGIGETATGAIVPAVANAVFAATGVRVRTLPIGSRLSV